MNDAATMSEPVEAINKSRKIVVTSARGRFASAQNPLYTLAKHYT